MSAQKDKCRIALDVMGGDFAPRSTVLGGIEAHSENSDKFEVLLVGKKQEILRIISENNLNFPDENIIHAEEVIEMSESPTVSVKSKPKSSINVCIDLQREKKSDAFVSAGNTGAVMTASTIRLGRIENVGRPTLGTIVPTVKGKSMVFDVGASVDCKPAHLAEFGLMGSIYMKEMFQIPNPSVGILSIGEEESKGNEVSLAAHKILSKSRLNFIGNVEGRDVLKGDVDVIVCDGFVGNIILKFAEGFLSFLKDKLKEYSELNIINKLKVGIAKNSLKEILGVFDYQQYGGVPLLGINGITIIGHGSSTPLAIKNMIIRAYETYEKNITERIRKALQEFNINNL